MDARARLSSGGAGFENSSAKGEMGGLVSNSTLPVLLGVSVLMVGIWLGLPISKPHDKDVNANGGNLILHSDNVLEF